MIRVMNKDAPLKVFYVDPDERDIVDADIHGEFLPSARTLIRAEHLDVGRLKGFDLWVDDNGIAKGALPYLVVDEDGEPEQVLFGVSLAAGVDEEGNTVSCPLSQGELSKRIRFGSQVQVGRRVLFVTDSRVYNLERFSAFA